MVPGWLGAGSLFSRRVSGDVRDMITSTGFMNRTIGLLSARVLTTLSKRALSPGAEGWVLVGGSKRPDQGIVVSDWLINSYLT